MLRENSMWWNLPDCPVHLYTGLWICSHISYGTYIYILNIKNSPLQHNIFFLICLNKWFLDNISVWLDCGSGFPAVACHTYLGTHCLSPWSIWCWSRTRRRWGSQTGSDCTCVLKTPEIKFHEILFFGIMIFKQKK